MPCLLRTLSVFKSIVLANFWSKFEISNRWVLAAIMEGPCSDAVTISRSHKTQTSFRTVCFIRLTRQKYGMYELVKDRYKKDLTDPDRLGQRAERYETIPASPLWGRSNSGWDRLSNSSYLIRPKSLWGPVKPPSSWLTSPNNCSSEPSTSVSFAETRPGNGQNWPFYRKNTGSEEKSKP